MDANHNPSSPGVLGYSRACPFVSWHFWVMSILTEAIKEYLRKWC
jgi:hypothetical protein